MNTPASTYKRRNFFINKKLQGRFTMYFLVLGLLITVSASALIWFLSMEEFDSLAIRTHLSSTSAWEVIFPILLKALGLSTLLLVVSTFLLTHFIFKRLSTKLSSFDAALLNVGKGDLTTAVPKGGLEELNEPLQAFIDKLRADITSLNAIHGDMKKLSWKADGASKKDMEGLSSNLSNKISEWHIKTD